MERGIIFKSGTSLYGLHPKIRTAIWKARRVFLDAGHRLVVTSAWDFTHGQNSFHHYGMAVDFRSQEIPTGMKATILARLKQALGGEFDVILEDLGGGNEHFHVEWEAGRDLRESWLSQVLLGAGEAVPAEESQRDKPFWKIW